jgi:hypothetical protein
MCRRFTTHHDTFFSVASESACRNSRPNEKPAAEADAILCAAIRFNGDAYSFS